MDMVVNRLSDIEAASVRITEEAGAQKKELDSLMKLDLQKFDEEIDTKTQAELQQLKEELAVESEKALDCLQQDTAHLIEQLEADYKSNHEKLAAAVLKKLVEE